MQSTAPHLTKWTRQTHEWLKTDNSLTLYADFEDPERLAAANECWNWVEAFLKKVEQRLSLARPGSDLSRFNAAAPGSWTPVSPSTAELVELALEMNRLTDGLYNPATGHLTDLWGFSPRTFAPDFVPERPYDRPRVDGAMAAPDARYVDAFAAGCRLDGLAVEKRQGKCGLVKPGCAGAETGTPAGDSPSAPAEGPQGADPEAPALMLDLGGIAKGWVADAVLAMVSTCGFTYAAYSCESSMALSKSAAALAQQRGDACYTLQLASPRPLVGVPNYLQLRIRDRCVATSGDYGRCHVRDGLVFSHIIDPTTGLPMNVTRSMAWGDEHRQSGLCTVTLLGPSAAQADALATALCLMGPQRAIAFYNEKLADQGWDLVAVAYDTERPEVLELITSLAEGTYHIVDQRVRLASTAEGGHVALLGR